MRNKIISYLFIFSIGFSFFSCSKKEDPTPTEGKKINVPLRIAKTKSMSSIYGVNDGFTTYTLTTSEGFTYNLTFQETGGYTAIVVTQPGGVAQGIGGACINRIVALLEKWVNDSQTLFLNQDNACSVLQQFISDFRSLRDCVPAEVREEFDTSLDQIDLSKNQYCQ